MIGNIYRKTKGADSKETGVSPIFIKKVQKEKEK
jgi:hypothetical protein